MNIGKMIKRTSMCCVMGIAGTLWACGSDSAEHKPANKEVNNIVIDVLRCEATEEKVNTNGTTACTPMNNRTNNNGANSSNNKAVANTNNITIGNSNNATTSSTNNGTTTGETTPTSTPPATPISNEQLCADAFKKYFDTCVNQICTLGSEKKSTFDDRIANQDITKCAQNLAANPESKTRFESILYSQCQDLKANYCADLGLVDECGCVPTDAQIVGTKCSNDADCGTQGDFSPVCIPEVDNAGQETGFTGGYCSSRCINPLTTPTRFESGPDAEVACGLGNVCRLTEIPGSREARCLQGECSETSDCRSGYVCGASVAINNPNDPHSAFVSRYCIPDVRCQSDADCGGLTCKSDNTCEMATEYFCNELPVGRTSRYETGNELCKRIGGTCKLNGDKERCILN